MISTERLKRDLEEWETLYVAGRLHKPVSGACTSISFIYIAKQDSRHKCTTAANLLAKAALPLG